MFTKFKLSPEDWLIKEKGFHPHKQGMHESLFTLGNGYLGVRGSLEENPKGSYRGMYIAGIFDKSEGLVTELVKAPSWLDFSVWINNKKFSFDTCRVLSHNRVLDMRKGVLHRTTRFKDSRGRILKVATRRIVFAHQVRGAVMDAEITPENFSGELKVISGLNGDVTNLGYYQNERTKHLSLTGMKRSKGHIYIEMKTREKKIKIAMAATTVFSNPPTGHVKVNRIYGEKFTEEETFHAVAGKRYDFTKWVSILTSREGYEKQLESSTTDLLHDMIREGLDFQLQQHLKAMEEAWERADILVKGDPKAQKGIRFNIYHLLSVKPHHDSTVSIGAKFLTGEGYKGHVFWDTEIFILPFYLFNFPEEAKNLLMYRYYTLGGSIENAKRMNYRGAKIAWESADRGLETTPDWGYRFDGTTDKIFTGDEEHHIVSDVAYAIRQYVEATGDDDFLHNIGAEIIFQTARFWLSRIEKRRGRYEIRKVIGPDEFHEHVDNNAFTNYMVIWHLSYAVEIYKKMKKEVPALLKRVANKIKLRNDEIEQMALAAKVIFFPYDEKTHLVEQFEGYFSLEDHKIDKLDKHGLPELPRGVKRINLRKTQLVKQADVVLLLYLFLDRFTDEFKKVNYTYYEARTMHESSLSPCTHALMGLEIGDHKRAYDYFIKTSYMDLLDIAKSANKGIHAAATGGAWMTIIHGFAGMKIRRGALTFDPWLPKKWQELSYTFSWQGNLIAVRVSHGSIALKIVAAKDKIINVAVQGKTVKLKPRKTTRVRLKKKY
jgi:kojibiose phosphorylase